MLRVKPSNLAWTMDFWHNGSKRIVDTDNFSRIATKPACWFACDFRECVRIWGNTLVSMSKPLGLCSWARVCPNQHALGVLSHQCSVHILFITPNALGSNIRVIGYHRPSSLMSNQQQVSAKSIDITNHAWTVLTFRHWFKHMEVNISAFQDASAPGWAACGQQLTTFATWHQPETVDGIPWRKTGTTAIEWWVRNGQNGYTFDWF